MHGARQFGHLLFGFLGCFRAANDLSPIATFAAQRQQSAEPETLAIEILGRTQCTPTSLWLPEATEEQRRYFVCRCLFAIVTSVDFPLIELSLLIVFCWAHGAMAQGRQGSAAGPALDPLIGRDKNPTTSCFPSPRSRQLPEHKQERCIT
jgi:hypothetical protein